MVFETLPRGLRYLLLAATHRWSFLPNFRGKWFIRKRLIRLCTRAQMRDGPMPLRLRSGLRIIADFATGMSRWIVTNDYGEDLIVKALDQVLRPGHAVIDIGANIGFVSLLCAQRVWPNGRVIAFEPGASARSQLLQNLALNTYSKIIAVRDSALGATSGHAYLRHSGLGAEDTAFLDYASDLGGTHEDVVVERLDDALREVPTRYDFIKIDVEGREFDVLRGGVERLARDRPSLMVELSLSQQTRCGYHPRELVEWLLEKGYSLSTVERGLAPFEASHVDAALYINVLCRPPN